MRQTSGCPACCTRSGRLACARLHSITPAPPPLPSPPPWQVVTYKWLGRKFGVPYDTAKRVLFDFLTRHPQVRPAAAAATPLLRLLPCARACRPGAPQLLTAPRCRPPPAPASRR